MKFTKLTASGITLAGVLAAIALVVLLGQTGRDAVKHYPADPAAVAITATTAPAALVAPQSGSAGYAAAQDACDSWAQVVELNGEINGPNPPASDDSRITNLHYQMDFVRTRANDAANADAHYTNIKAAYILYATDATADEYTITDACKADGFND